LGEKHQVNQSAIIGIYTKTARRIVKLHELNDQRDINATHRAILEHAGSHPI